MPTAMRDVRSRGQSGKHILAVSLSGFDPGCVKTPMPNFRLEFPSRFRSSRNQIALAASVGSRQLRKQFWGA
jgi:hypothetical protein